MKCPACLALFDPRVGAIRHNWVCTGAHLDVTLYGRAYVDRTGGHE